MKHFKSVFQDEQECLKALISIHLSNGGIDCDPMFFKGNFYKEIPRPKYCFDLNPVVSNCEQADASALPLERESLNSMILDPPFLICNRPSQFKYYSSRTHTYFTSEQHLADVYNGILKEAYRVLKKGGTLIFKCQDYTDSKTTMTHCKVYNWATEIGFYAKDIAILVLPNKVYNGNTTQRHLRKVHTYFWVFKKLNKGGK